MAVNYRISFKNYYGNDCTISLIEDYAVTEFTELTAAADPLDIIYTPENSDDVFSAMVTSKAKIRVAIDGENQAFLERMAILQEGEYQIDIRWGIFGIWTGALVPDEQTRSFSLIGGEIEITAVDRLTQMKGKKLIDSDGAFITGEHTLNYYVDRAFLQVQPVGAPGVDTKIVYSSLVLSNNTSTVFPDILDQLSVYAEAFNDDMGRPINCYDAIKMIAESLCMRCMYIGNFLFFIDILDYLEPLIFGADPVKIGFKGTADLDAIFMNNSENITTEKTFVESICKFEYKNIVGLLVDGYLQNWQVSGTGLILSDWDYSPNLLAAPDYEDRRVGNGRVENPFGILLKEYTDSTHIDEIGGHCIYEMYNGDHITVDISTHFPDITQIEPTAPGGVNYALFCNLRAVIYNESNPADSNYLSVEGGNTNSEYAWWNIDLSGSSFASGEFDFDALFAGESPGITSMVIITASVLEDQTNTVDFPGILMPGQTGKLFISVGAFSNMTGLFTFKGIDTVVTSVIASKTIPKTNNRIAKGDIVYVSRDNASSTTKMEKEISLNTTGVVSIGGSIMTPLSYTRTSDSVVVPAGPVPYISRKGSATFNNVQLHNYNAMVRMVFNYNQYRIDFEAKGNYINFSSPIDFSSLYDPTRPSTDIYNALALMIQYSNNVKSCTYKITSASMKLNQRAFSKDTLNDTHDLVENYAIT